MACSGELTGCSRQAHWCKPFVPAHVVSVPDPRSPAAPALSSQDLPALRQPGHLRASGCPGPRPGVLSTDLLLQAAPSPAGLANMARPVAPPELLGPDLPASVVWPLTETRPTERAAGVGPARPPAPWLCPGWILAMAAPHSVGLPRHLHMKPEPRLGSVAFMSMKKNRTMVFGVFFF